MADIRWRGYTHDELHQMVHSGPGARELQPHGDYWRDLGLALAEIDTEVYCALSRLGATWEGQAAESAGGGLTPLGRWAGDAHTSSHHMGFTTDLQHDNIVDTRNAMPAPVKVTAERPNAVEGLLSDLFGVQTDYERQEAAADAAEQEAYRVMAVYSDTTMGNSAAMSGLEQPPRVVVDVPAPPERPRTDILDHDPRPSGDQADDGSGAGTGPGQGDDGSATARPPGAPTPGTPGSPPGPPAPTQPSAPGPGNPGGGPVKTVPTPPTPGPGTSGGHFVAPPPGGWARPDEPGGRGHGSSRIGTEDGARSRGHGGSPPGVGRGGPGAGPGGGPGVRLGGIADDAAVARTAVAAGRGTPASAPVLAGPGGRRAEDAEHKSPDYVVETVDIFGDDRRVAPPVIGEEPPVRRW